jgi:hypothetical protein
LYIFVQPLEAARFVGRPAQKVLIHHPQDRPHRMSARLHFPYLLTAPVRTL